MPAIITSPAVMTHRERILKTLRHEVPDRVPLDGWFRPELCRALEARLGSDWGERLGLDWGGAGGCGVKFIKWEQDKSRIAKPGDFPYANSLMRWHDERTFEDAWGVVHRVGQDGKYVEWLRGPLSDSDGDLDDLAHLIPEHELETVETVKKRVEETIASGRVATGGIPLPFKIAWMLRGMDNLFCDFLTEKEFAHALYDKLYDHFQKQVMVMAEAGTEIITVVGDIAAQDRLMFSHEIFDEFIKPRMTKLVREARRVSPREHLYFFYHCDGDMSSVLPDFVEDMGFDIINPIQPECMDCYEVKRKYGDRMTIHGTMSVVDLLPKGPVERIRAEVREKIDRLGYNGGFVLSSANVITYDTPLENVLAMYEEARNYRLGG
jgi:uroporphyrinogen decarboxylase